jgi:SHS2 domain-containing protein
MKDEDEARDLAPAAADGSYEEIEHTADLAFRVRGRSQAELFANAARALTCLECGVATGEPTVTREVEVNGTDRETLLVNWLNELLYLGQTKHESYHEFDIIEINDEHLRAHVRGQECHALRRIKAVTFHNLEVKQTPTGWQATIVVDV